MNGNTEYVGEGKETSKLKYFTSKMVGESNDMFVKVISFYRKKLKQLLKNGSVPVKLDLKVRISEKMI